jgi:uncharacterized protein (DUF736 family)|tara:strand:+ start:224 stop:541 length:318 start_codon:yes stop_codon:yes gene_type:complete
MADNSKTNSDWDKREVGALWTKTSQSSGKKYFSGHFKMENEFGEEKKVQVVAFYNKDKKSENQPDFRIYVSRPASEQQAEQAEQASAPATETVSAGSEGTEDVLL